MSLTPNRDYIFIGTASLHLPNRIIASGPLLVTAKGLTYASPFTTDLGATNPRRATNLADAASDVKAAAADVKATHASFSDLNATRRALRAIGETAPSLKHLHDALDAYARDSPHVLHVRRDDIASLEVGFFKGLRIAMQDGTQHHFRTGKLKAIRDMLGFA